MIDGEDEEITMMNSKQIAELVTKNVLDRVAKNSSRHTPSPTPGMMMDTRVPGGFPSSHPVLDFMKRRGLPITRETYLAIDYPQGAPDPFPAELEAGLPPEVRDL